MFERRAFWLVLVLAWLTPRAHAQVAVEQFAAQPLATDGFAVARTQLLEQRAWATSATLDYANDPLVYRLTRGPELSQRVISDQLALQLGAAFGVLPRLTLYASLPVNVWMRGDARLALPNLAPEGAGLGDLALAARVGIIRPEQGAFSLMGELIVRMPTAEWTRPSQRYSGDRVGSYEGALLGELRVGIVDMRLRVGVRFRAHEHIQDLALGQSLLFASGLRVRLPGEVSLHAELFGSTYATHAFRQHYTPLELLLGPKLAFAHGWAGVAAGPGLVDGYGSPDFRVIGTLGFGRAAQRAEPARAPEPVATREVLPAPIAAGPAAREPAPEPLVDADGDGVPDAQDGCPGEPGPASTGGCPEAPEPVPEGPAAVEFGTVQFARGFEHAGPTSEPTLRAVLSILQRNPQLTHVRIEGHADDTGDASFNDGLSGKRAQWVTRWLTARGIARERLEPVACGQRYPAQGEASEGARERSRRVEFVEVRTPDTSPHACPAAP